MRDIIRQRLLEAEKQLKAFESYYHNDTRFYADQVAYVSALREHLNALIDCNG